LLKRFTQLQDLSPPKAKRWLWERYCAMTPRERAEFIKQALEVPSVTSVAVEALPAVFGQQISHDALTIPSTSSADLCRLIQAPPLIVTGWYDWGLNDALATWRVFRRQASPEVAGRARMIVTASAHNMPGYHEGVDTHPELMRMPGAMNQVGLLLKWYATVRERSSETWPTVIYYLMGANEWRVSSDWPISEAKDKAFYFAKDHSLATEPPLQLSQSDHYIYDPNNPTPTVGGSVLSYMYPQGSVDVSAVQQRADVLVFSTPPLERDLDIVGPIRMILYASSSASDTDFVARLSDVFPDGRAIQIQSGILRARYRSLDAEPELLEPGRIERFEIDLWSTANRFKTGHRLRVDVSSADFPHFDRNSNRGGKPGEPIPAHQTVYYDRHHPSHLLVSVL
jgi:uncharacterized protein